MATRIDQGTNLDSLNIKGVQGDFNDLLIGTEKALRDKMKAMPSSPSQSDLIDMQMQFQLYSMTVSMVSTSVKEIGDTLKAVIQKF